MEKQMMLLFVVGAIVGALALYGASSITGMAMWQMASADDLSAVGLKGSPVGMNAQVQVEVSKILKDLEVRYPGEKLAISRAPEIGLNSDGEAFHIERLVVTRNGVFDQVLTAEVLGMLNEKFQADILTGKLAVMQSPIGGLMAVFGGKEEGAMALLGLQDKVFNPGSIEILSDMAHDQMRAYAIFDEVKQLRDSGVIQSNDEIVIMAFDGQRFVLGLDGERMESMSTPIYAVYVLKGIVPIGGDPVNVAGTEALARALNGNEQFTGKCLVLPLTNHDQLFTAGMVHAALSAENPDAAILAIGAEFEAFEQLIGVQMPNSEPGGSDITQY